MPSVINGESAVSIRETGDLWLEVPEAAQDTVEKDDRLSICLLFVVEVGPVTLDVCCSNNYTLDVPISLRCKTARFGE